LSFPHRALLIALPWLIVIAIWYAVAYSGLINPSLVPTPHRVAARFYELLTAARLPVDILMSTQRVVIGVALGIAVAVPAGFVLGWYKNVRMFIDPLMNFFRALPPIALIPLVIVYFGIGEVAKVVILFYASFFAGVIVMYEGIAQISPIYVRVSRTLGATDSEIFQGHHPADGAAPLDGAACSTRRRVGDARRVRAHRRATGTGRTDPERVVVLPARHHLRRHHLHRTHRARDGRRAARGVAPPRRMAGPDMSGAGPRPPWTCDEDIHGESRPRVTTRNGRRSPQSGAPRRLFASPPQDANRSPAEGSAAATAASVGVVI